MKMIVFIVEGDSESEFVKRILTPFLNSFQIFDVLPIKITKKGGGHGVDNIEHFKNTIRPILSYNNEPVITTFIDHYGLNSQKKLPGYDECVKKPIALRLEMMENKLDEVVQSIKPYRFFVPYIQQHEFETLLFANPEQGFDLEDEKIKEEIISLCNSVESIENINDTPQGAPSVRLNEIFARFGKKYQKGVEGMYIAELTTIEKMFEKCPRFYKWIRQLINICQQDGTAGMN